MENKRRLALTVIGLVLIAAMLWYGADNAMTTTGR